MSKIIAIANQKGGVGKTTTCVNLSSYIAAMGKRVLVVDIDPQGNASSGFGIEKSKLKSSIYDVLSGEVSAKEALVSTGVNGLEILPSSIDLAGAEIELIKMSRREYVLKNALIPLQNDYDYMFIDCPPSLGLLTLNAITSANSILIPIPGEFYALEGLSQLMNTIKIVKQNINPTIEVEGVVLTMYDTRSNLVSSVTDEILKYFGRRVFTTRIPRNVRLAEAPSYGMPIMQFEPKSTGSIAYRALAEEFLNRNHDKFERISNLSSLRKRRQR